MALVTTNGGRQAPADSTVALRQKTIYPTLQPASAVQSNTLRGGSSNLLQFILRNGNAGHYMKKAFLKIVISNSAAGAGDTVTLNPALTLWNEIRIKEKGTLITSYPGVPLWVLLNSFNDDEAIQRLCQSGGYSNTTYLGNVATAGAGGTSTFIVPVETLLNNSGIFLGGNAFEFMYEFVPSGDASTVKGVAAGGLLSGINLISAEMIFESIQLEEDALRDQFARIQANPNFSYRTLVIDQAKALPSQAVTAGTQFKQTLNISGKCGGMFVGLRPTGAVGDQVVSPLSIDNVDILTATNQSLLNANPPGLSQDFLQNLISVSYFKGSFNDTIKWLPIMFSDNIVESFQSGSTYGRIQLSTATEQIAITPTATTAAAQVYIIPFMGATFKANMITGQWALEV